MTEKDIIICGHGSGTPSTKNMYTYLESRYQSKASNGVRKGVVAVKRLKAMTDAGRKAFHDTYKTILGRNLYNQDLRSCVFTKHKDGKYYSDCSSSICATYKKIGYNVSLLNTAGIYQSSLFEDVPVTIKNGHIQNPEILKVGDALLFAGNDPSRPRQIGHTESVYEMPTDGWEKQSNGTWKYKKNGSYVKDKWLEISGRWYAFDGAGKMLSEVWKGSDSKGWYYLGKDGAMLASQWLKYKNKDYYLMKDGKMATDAYILSSDKNKYYYVDKNGVWDTKRDTNKPDIKKVVR